MKLKEGLVINKIDNNYILVDIGLVKPTFNGMIKLNKTSKEIIDLLKDDIKEEDIISIIAKNYNMPKNKIKKDVKSVIDVLKKANLITI